MSSLVRPESAFADTERLPPADELDSAPASTAPGPLRWFGCGCGKEPLVRVGRSPWMRWVPLFALYECGACGAHVFRRRLPYRPARAVYLQARPGVAAHLPKAVARMLERFARADLR